MQKDFENKFLGEFEDTESRRWVSVQINTNEVFVRGIGFQDSFFVTMNNWNYKVKSKYMVRID